MRLQFTLLAVFIMSAVFSQDKKVLEQFNNMNMRSVGPAVTSGRVTAIDVNEQNENEIYIGTASGGLWKSSSGGTTWAPLFDKENLLGIGSVCIDPSNPDVIWAGTGEGNPRNSQTSGRGIYKSLDAGRTWKFMGLEKTKTIHRVIVSKANSDVVYAAAHGSAWGPNPDRGVFRSLNGGNSWENILFVNDTVGCADLVMDPVNPDKLIAAMYQYARQPHFFTSGGSGSGLHITVDAGKTWIKLTSENGLPEGNLGRIGLAVSASNHNVIYALIESKKTGLYRSDDGGYNWNLVTEQGVGDRPFYYHEIYVDPQNENHLYYLHSIMSESIDGGKTWKTILPYWGVHPDHHAFWISPKNPKFLIEGNDGGLNISRDGGGTWTFSDNLPLGQFYHINYDLDTPYHIYGGMQDNGSWKGPAYVWHGGGIRDEDWQEVLFGDGFDVMPKRNNSRIVYAMSQGGELNEIDSETGASRYIKPVHPDGKKLRYNWNAALAQDPTKDCGIYFGSQYLHYTDDCGASWKIISPDLTTNDSTKLNQSKSGGLTIDATAAENHCTIISILPSSFDKQVIWVGTDDGNLQLTTDGGSNWKNLNPFMVGLPRNAWIPQIVQGASGAGEVFVVVNNYRQNDWKPYLFHTTDFGKTWKNLVNSDQIMGHCLSVVQDLIEPKLIFLGTENGLYVSFDSGMKWHKWTHNYPSVATQDLKIHPKESDLIIATFGRAAFILDDITPLRIFAGNQSAFAAAKLKALPVQDAYQSNFIQPKGKRFPADLHFSGDNRDAGARLSYFFKVDEPEEKKDAGTKAKKTSKDEKEKIAQPVKEIPKTDSEKVKKEKDKKVTIWILGDDGDTLRTLTQEPDTGMNYLSWYFEMKGEHLPSYDIKKPEIDDQGVGMSVKPGRYKVVYKFNEAKDSTYVNVFHDPRLNFSEENYNAKKNQFQKWSGLVKEGREMFDQLKEAKSTIELVKGTFVNVPDSLKKEVMAAGDSLNKEIDSLMELFMQPKGTTGITDNSEKLTSYYWDALSYLYLSDETNYDNSTAAIRLAQLETDKIKIKVNDFFAKNWSGWQKKVELVQIRLFPKIKKF
jgi:photosystem II stability/assembly factor-like uncharacterized protein